MYAVPSRCIRARTGLKARDYNTLEKAARGATLAERACMRFGAAALICGLLGAAGARADEIRLKDGKKLYGEIVAYEDNMFKVKTDFGYVLVEKDKIASIVPTAPTAATGDTKKESAGKKDSGSKSSAAAEAHPAVASGAQGAASVKEASAKTVAPADNASSAKTGAKIGNAAVRPSLPASSSSSVVAAPAAPTLAGSSTAANGLAAPSTAPAPPKEEPPVNREEVQGNLYTNFTYGFRMYKAPSWNVLEDARTAVPNAIVALGTNDESTLMVVGKEKSKETLDATAKAVERRLSEVYENYQQISQRKATVSGLPAQEFRYRGKADGHDWSGTLVVIGRGSDAFTVLGMTHADTDLIQIQENVIARAIGSLNFGVH